MNKINYQYQSDQIIEGIRKQGKVPSLLLHSCCAPCSSYVLEYLSQYFNITVFYYNPNIAPQSEFEHRASEQQRLLSLLDAKYPVTCIIAQYDNARFEALSKGMEHLPEGGARCLRCFRLRLEETAKVAKEQSFDFFTTTLTISPLKNAQALNQIGEALSAQYDVDYFYSDFKKREGYKRSIELSKMFGLYRQSDCGCQYSKAQAEESPAKNCQA